MQSLITTKQAAELTGKHEETIRRWCRKGKIKSTKIEREFLIPISEFKPMASEETENKRIVNYVFGT